jgi:hypothetical protein
VFSEIVIVCGWLHEVRTKLFEDDTRENVTDAVAHFQRVGRRIGRGRRRVVENVPVE